MMYWEGNHGVSPDKQSIGYGRAEVYHISAAEGRVWPARPAAEEGSCHFSPLGPPSSVPKPGTSQEKKS